VTADLLSDVVRFVIPRDVCDLTDATLRDAGRQHAEVFALWTGNIENGTFTAAGVYVPDQIAHELAEGLCVTVDGEALHTLNLWLYQNRQTLAVQVHTHPTRAYHSTTDDTYPIVTQRGGLSLVVPDFASNGVRGPGTALYRLGNDGWRRTRRGAARRLLRLSDTV
jgi:hypothetical protein